VISIHGFEYLLVFRGCLILTCSENTLIERHKKRGDAGEVSFEWLSARHPDDFVINTDDKSVEQIVKEIKNIIN